MKAPTPRSPAPAPRPASSPPPARPASPRAAVRPSRANARSGRGTESESPAPLPEGLEHAPPAAGAPPGYSHTVASAPPPPPAPPPDAPAAAAVPMTVESLQMLVAPSGPMPLDTTAEDSGGSYFVRMVSPMNHVRAIPVGAVCNRLTNGWRFIEGEPVIPRVHCAVDRQDVCDLAGTVGFFPRPRALAATPVLHLDAVRVWLNEFLLDQHRYAGRKDLDLSYGRRLVSQFTRPAGTA